MANAGGNWLAVIQGFAGVRNALQSEKLSVFPHLPEHWQKLQFTLVWHGCPVKLVLTSQEIRAHNLGTHMVPAVLAGHELDLMPGAEATVMLTVAAPSSRAESV